MAPGLANAYSMGSGKCANSKCSVVTQGGEGGGGVGGWAQLELTDALCIIIVGTICCLQKRQFILQCYRLLPLCYSDTQLLNFPLEEGYY